MERQEPIIENSDTFLKKDKKIHVPYKDEIY